MIFPTSQLGIDTPCLLSVSLNIPFQVNISENIQKSRLSPVAHSSHHLTTYQAISTFQEDELNIAVKQYVPLDYAPQPGDITILATHASAFPKELYEPLWDDLLEQSRKAGYSIRSIWMADVANQGASYCLNETKIGSDRKYPTLLENIIVDSNDQWTSQFCGSRPRFASHCQSLSSRIHQTNYRYRS